MDPDVIIKRLVAGRVVITEGAEPGIYRGLQSTIVDCNFPGGAKVPHGWLRYQVVEADVLVVPIILVFGVYYGAVTPLQTTDKIQGLHDWVFRLWKAAPGRVAAEAFVNNCLKVVC